MKFGKGKEALKKKEWSPYWVGAGIGLLETAAMLTAKKPLGITTAFENMAALAAEKISPEAMDVEEFEEERGQTPKIDWEAGLVAGVVVGSLLASQTSESEKPPNVPDKWREKIGESKILRYAAAAGGGALMMFGARMAKGCTSGHGISGTMQLAASSWLFAPIMFLSGAAVAKTLFGRSR